ncbi:hypothetical protein Tsubulata_026314 [Turnera subulata]|uniref:ENTH domain-containing protein n=1 Tax=Turnera subulata TaxID=218843 RepID=A0A9Q0JLK5_9ROSI|nr:hypothetical protein Tsubulata_026314 [Turnera subulata]
MSLLSKSNSGGNMGASSFHEFKKQASFFLKEKIKSARLALTDVTPAQLLTEEATSGNPWSPDARTLGSISRAAFEVDDYWRIVEILHNRFLRFERKNWRASYNSLIVLEYLLTRGPESASGEFQNDKDVIKEMGSFQFIDEKGFNWGLVVRKKTERILKLLEKGTLLKEERDKARKLTRGIQGFGSFSQRSSSAQGILQESSRGTFGRSNSQFNNSDDNQQFLFSNEENLIQEVETSQKNANEETVVLSKKEEEIKSLDSVSNGWMFEKPETSFKENMAPAEEEMHRWDQIEEDNPLLGGSRDEPRVEEEAHPFSYSENHTRESLTSAGKGILQGC